MYTKAFYEAYKRKCFEQLGKLRMPNGTFRASNSDAYNATWIRDNYYCAMAYLSDKQTHKYLETVHTHLDFLMNWEKQYGKLNWIIKEPYFNDENAFRFIHPKINFDGTEIEGLKWQFLQADTLAYLLLLATNGLRAKIPVFRSFKDKRIVQRLIYAMEAIEIYKQEFAHAWEEEKGIFLSNMGLFIYSLQEAACFDLVIDKEHLRKLRHKFYEQLPCERAGRNIDLTQLFICILPNFLHESDIEELRDGVQDQLFKTYGTWRYIDDLYKPFCDVPSEPMQWIMGNSFLSLIYSKLNQLKDARYYVNKVCNLFPNADIPEGVDSNKNPCDNRILAWSIAMQIQAINSILALM